MNSRVHPKYKTKYRVANWPEYERGLVQRRDVAIWLSPDAISAWAPAPSGRRGGQRKYSDIAIETALTLRLIFRLPLRQAEGFLRSLLDLIGLSLEAPDHSTLSRRSKGLNVKLIPIVSKRPIHLNIDSTGLSIVGEGEWAAAKHGGRGKRGWRKLHLGVDRAGVICTQALTNSSGDDATTGIKVIKKTKGKLSSVTGDAAYDTAAIYNKAGARGARVVFPPTRTASMTGGGPRSAERGKTIRRAPRSAARDGRRSRATIIRGRSRTPSSGASRRWETSSTPGVWLHRRRRWPSAARS